MMTNEQVLSRYSDDLKQRGLSLDTQKQYLRMSCEFLEWANRKIEELSEEDIKNYLDFLANHIKLKDSTIRVRNTVIRLLLFTITDDQVFFSDSRRKLVKSGCLKEPKIAFMQYLLDMGYTKSSLRDYKWVIGCIDHFIHERGYTRYSRNIGKAFLKDAVKSGRHTTRVLMLMGYVLRRFDCFMEQDDFAFFKQRISRESPAQFAGGLINYLDSMRLHGLRESTIERKRYNIHKALMRFDSVGISSLSGITPEAIYDAFESASDKHGFSSPMRGFMYYLYDTGVIQYDYSGFVPSVRRNRPVPSVYTKAEIEKFLECMDISTKSGIRKKAATLLALRVGLRSGDIANLKFSDVDFAAKTISIVQEKTQIPLRLELLPEIEEALTLYIYTARPVSNIPNIFLSLKSPIRSMSEKAIYSFVSAHFKDSGLISGNRKRGAHALRMTLASELVAEKVPYDAVRKILGHEDPFVIKRYVEIDIDELRSCAIEIMRPTGRLAEYMQARIGGNA